MKHAWIAVLYLVTLVFPISSHAFLCNGKDLGCLKGWILPDNQTSTGNKREWAANQGTVTGKDDVIIFKLTFDQQSLDTLGYRYPWYSPRNTLFKGFGLEIDVCDPSGTLRFDSVKSTFPSAARPTRDTDLSDNINPCKNAMGMLVRNPGALVPGEEYEVQFFLKDPLPSDGVVITPSLQISADTHLLDYAALIEGQPYLFDGNLLGGYLDKFEYFAVETDSYQKYWDPDAKQNPWKVYRDGREGVCWDSKETSYPCSTVNSIALPDSQDVQREQAPRPFGVTTLPAIAPVEIPPDFIVRKTWLVTPWGVETYKFGMQESFDTKAQSKNIGDGNCVSGEIDTITGHFYLSRGYKEDVHSGDGAWRRIDSTTTQCDNLQPGNTHTETKNTVISEWIDEPGIYNIVYCIDHPLDDHNNGGDHQEKHESNNCSTEAVFEVTADAYVNVPDTNLIVSAIQVKGSATQLPAGGVTTLQMAIRNIGTITPTSGIRSNYSFCGPLPGTTCTQVADDLSEAAELTPGRDQWEETQAPVGVPSVAGSYLLKGCADYQNAVNESDETDNCTASTVTVVIPSPDFIVSAFGLREGTSIKSGTRVHPWCTVKNVGGPSPSAIRLSYYINADVFRDNDTVEAYELCAGCSKFEEVQNDNIKLGDRGTRTYRCCVDYQGAVTESNEGNNCSTMSFTVW